MRVQLAIADPSIDGGITEVESTGGMFEIALGAIEGVIDGVPIAVQAIKIIEMTTSRYFLFMYKTF